MTLSEPLVRGGEFGWNRPSPGERSLVGECSESRVCSSCLGQGGAGTGACPLQSYLMFARCSYHRNAH